LSPTSPTSHHTTTLSHTTLFRSRKDSHVRIEEDRLVLSPLEAESRPASATALADRIAERLPRVALPDLLIEVDSWTHFSQHCVRSEERRVGKESRCECWQCTAKH